MLKRYRNWITTAKIYIFCHCQSVTCSFLFLTKTIICLLPPCCVRFSLSFPCTRIWIVKRTQRKEGCLISDAINPSIKSNCNFLFSELFFLLLSLVHWRSQERREIGSFLFNQIKRIHVPWPCWGDLVRQSGRVKRTMYCYFRCSLDRRRFSRNVKFL